MSYSKIGIKSIVFSEKNALLTSPSYPVFPGVRLPATMTIKGHNEPTDFRDRKLRNMLNVLLEVTTLQTRTTQGNFALLGILAYFCKTGGADLQVIGQESVFSTDKFIGDIYNFTGVNNFMGIDFEYMLSPKGREVKIMFEVAKSYNDIKAIIDASETAESCATVNAQSTTGYAGYDFTKVEMPVLRDIDSPIDTSILNVEDIDDWKITFKSKGNKSNLTNRSIVNYITTTLELTTLDASTTNLKSWLAKSQYLNTVLQIQTGDVSESYDFKLGVLSHSDEITIGDENRNAKFVWNADIPVTDFFNAVNGQTTLATFNL